MVPVDDGASPAPIDRAVLRQIRSRFAGGRQTDAARIVEDGKRHVRVELSGDYYPNEVSARFEIRWYRTDDFTIHYREERDEETWQCRWDRHPNVHNSRDHFYPPPAASRTDARDADWPNDHRDVCRLVLDYLEERIETLWE
ncbi:hypothetical protein [Halorhabdus rudnickae]|uniref:hypothetical protein n=1 Tax=Halorhabdus rudnickae TaxID=1775544 RepID=UPI0010846168|nr:hypothetical protein [Halorhabdus rudnickae]